MRRVAFANHRDLPDDRSVGFRVLHEFIGHTGLRILNRRPGMTEFRRGFRRPMSQEWSRAFAVVSEVEESAHTGGKAPKPSIG